MTKLASRSLKGIPSVLRQMSLAREHRPLGAGPLLEDVAHGVESGAVPAADREDRERRGRQLAERDLGLPRRALDHERARTLEEGLGEATPRLAEAHEAQE